MGMIQINAIRSWLALCPPCEVLLLGDDDGTAEIAKQFSIRHIPDIQCNEYGTPLISSLFQTAEVAAQHELLCQINADIMLTDDFLSAISKVCSLKQKFLVTGQRWGVNIEKPWDFDKLNWQRELCDHARKYGRLQSVTALDYFVFPKGLWGELPPFAIGRRRLDNWLIYRARSLGVPVIDVTKAVTAVHQNHDYSFHMSGKSWIMEGPEVQRNMDLAGGWEYIFSLLDATHKLTPNGLKPAISRRHLQRRIWTLPTLYPYLAPLSFLRKPIERGYQIVRWFTFKTKNNS